MSFGPYHPFAFPGVLGVPSDGFGGVGLVLRVPRSAPWVPKRKRKQSRRRCMAGATAGTPPVFLLSPVAWMRRGTDIARSASRKSVHRRLLQSSHVDTKHVRSVIGMQSSCVGVAEFAGALLLAKLVATLQRPHATNVAAVAALVRLCGVAFVTNSRSSIVVFVRCALLAPSVGIAGTNLHPGEIAVTVGELSASATCASRRTGP